MREKQYEHPTNTIDIGRRLMTKRTICTAALILALAAGASAQAGLYLGMSGGVSSQRLDLQGVDLDRDTSFVYGLQAGVEVLMLGFEVQYLQASHNLALAEFPEIGWGDRVVDYNFLGFNGKLYLFSTLVRPYIALGYGYYTQKLKDIDKDTVSGFNYGVGLELKLGKRFALRGEGKYHPHSVEWEDREVKVKNFTLVGGMNFYF
jgi:hypothetical protein